MNINKLLPALMLLCSVVTGTFAQQPNHCATMDNLNDKMDADPLVQQQFEAFEARVAEYLEENPDVRANAIVTIPVVFHVIHNGQPIGTQENVTDDQIMSQLDALNRDFRRRASDTSDTPAAFKSVAADAQIDFCLARFDPLGQPHPGINRYDLGQSSWDRPDIESTVKPTTIWDASKYLNIWIMRFSGSLSSVLGYAQFPGMAANTDGVCIDYQAFGTMGSAVDPHDMGRTAVHEVGHWLGLRHIWGDDQDDPPADWCLGDDLVGDTPNQEINYFGCPTVGVGTCGSMDMFMNYMDYTDDDCTNLFTAGQAARMAGVLNTDRSGLLAPSNPTLCQYFIDAELADVVYPSSTMCTNVFRPSARVRNLASTDIYNMDIQYQLDGGSFTLENWAGYLPAGGEVIISAAPINVPDGNHTISMFVTNPNGVGNDDYTLNDLGATAFFVQNQGSGTATPWSEGFESGFPVTGWTVVNPDSDRAWEEGAAGGFGSSSKSMKFDNYTLAGSPAGKVDGMVSPKLDFQNANFPYISFDYAYVQRNANTEDSLKLYYSLDCGMSWQLIYADGGAGLATSVPIPGFAFTPGSGDWDNKIVGIPQAEGNVAVQFMFENKSGAGNNMWVDNVNITSSPVAIQTVDPGASLILYPNPAQDVINLDIQSDEPVRAVRVFNTMGIQLTDAQWNETMIDIRSIPSGMYIVQVETETQIFQNSFIKTK